ncbi:MAG TPA: hypothetical protein VM221_08630, partial [Armatimonadota bacterium]|nr:hypothetical protein [Armatimonadota bacterium]
AAAAVVAICEVELLAARPPAAVAVATGDLATQPAAGAVTMVDTDAHGTTLLSSAMNARSKPPDPHPASP